MAQVAVLVVVRLVFIKPHQQVAQEHQVKVLLAVVLPLLQVQRVQGLVLVEVVHHKREIPKTQTLVALVVMEQQHQPL
jgi:hypothetical protein